MRSTNRKRRGADAGTGGRKRRTSKATVLDEDITAPKRAEEALRESEERFRSLVASSQDGIVAYDTDLRFTIWNPAMERTSGLRSEEVLGRTVFEVFPFLEEVGEADAFRDAAGGKATTRTDIPYSVPQTDRSGYFESSHFPLLDAQGRNIGGMAIIRDVTSRRRAEEAFRRSRQLLQSTYDTIPDAVISTDSNRNVIACNSSVERVLGYTPDELLGKNYSVFVAERMFEDPGLPAREAELLEKGYLETDEYYFKRKSG